MLENLRDKAIEIVVNLRPLLKSVNKICAQLSSYKNIFNRIFLFFVQLFIKTVLKWQIRPKYCTFENSKIPSLNFLLYCYLHISFGNIYWSFPSSQFTEKILRVRTYFHLTHFSVNYGIFYRNLRGKSFIVMKIKISRI